MQIDIKKNKKARYAFYVVGIAFIVCFNYVIYINFIAPPIPLAPATGQSSLPVKENIKEKSPAIISVSNKSNNISAVNPFIELSEIKMMNVKKENSGEVALSTGNARLPQIPSSFPRPMVGSLPLPAMQGAPIAGMGSMQQTQKTASSSAIKGILTGNAEGNNIAIMSDGKIVSAGDVYQDNRITSISGNGIEFEDGHTISYK